MAAGGVGYFSEFWSNWFSGFKEHYELDETFQAGAEFLPESRTYRFYSKINDIANDIFDFEEMNLEDCCIDDGEFRREQIILSFKKVEHQGGYDHTSKFFEAVIKGIQELNKDPSLKSFKFSKVWTDLTALYLRHGTDGMEQLETMVYPMGFSYPYEKRKFPIHTQDGEEQMLALSDIKKFELFSLIPEEMRIKAMQLAFACLLELDLPRHEDRSTTITFAHVPGDV